MRLVDLVADHPDLFYRQDWYTEQDFAHTPPAGRALTSILSVRVGAVPSKHETLPRAIDLAALYLRDPALRAWQHYLWTSDFSNDGFRVYVGGACEENGMKFEIHRHLAITEKWGCPTCL